VRAAALLSGATLSAVVLAACDGSATDAPFLVETSPLPTATATPTAVLTPTVVPTPTTAPEPAPSRIFFKRENELWSINRDGSDPLLLSAEVEAYYSGSLGLGSSSPLPSPQGNKVAFIGTGGNLWVIDSNGNNLKRLSEEGFPGDETYTVTHVFISGWSPDATKILYAVEFGGIGDKAARPEVGLGFHLVDLDTGKKTKLPLLQNFVAWSTDTETVIYDQYEQEEGGRTDWYTFNLGTGATSKLTTMPFECFSPQPSLFSDGNRLLYSCANSGVGSTIVIANIDNTNQRVLLEGQFAELQSPVFSPSAEGFIYEHHRLQPDRTVIIDLNFYDLLSGEQTLLASGFGKLKGWVDDRSALVLEAKDPYLGGSSTPITLYLVEVTSGARTKLADDVTFP